VDDTLATNPKGSAYKPGTGEQLPRRRGNDERSHVQLRAVSLEQELERLRRVVTSMLSAFLHASMVGGRGAAPPVFGGDSRPAASLESTRS